MLRLTTFFLLQSYHGGPLIYEGKLMGVFLKKYFTGNHHYIAFTHVETYINSFNAFIKNNDIPKPKTRRQFKKWFQCF